MRKNYLLILIVGVLMLTACGTAKNEETDDLKVLRIAKDTAVMTLDNSLAIDGMSFEVMENFIDGLVDKDADGKLMPRLAERWEASEDGLTHTFYLREDAIWDNGDPVTAHDFVYAWQRVLNPKTKAEYSLLIIDAGVKNATEVNSGEVPVEELGVEALDDYTFEVTLADTVPYFMDFLTFPIFNPLNESFVNELGDKYGQSPEGLLSNGPFKLTEWLPGSSLTLIKNDNYVDASTVHIDRIEYKILSDYQTSALEFDNGNIDYAKVSSDLVSRYADSEVFQTNKTGYLWYLAPNLGNEKLQNKDLRLALGHAIDRNHIVEEIMGDGSLAAEYVIPEGLAVGPDDKDFRETSEKYMDFDLKKANEYLEKAKESTGEDTFDLDLLIEDSEESRTNAEAIQSDLNSLDGVTITITTVPKSERVDRMRDGDYDLGLTRWGPDYSDPYTFLGTLFTTDATYNFSKYENPDYDTLISKTGVGGEFSQNPETRWQAFKDAEAMLLNDGGIIPIWQSSQAIIVNPKVKGIEHHVVGTTTYRNATIGD